MTDVACGSGDAQTLCITDDDSVWSWGDGDYGKLGLLQDIFLAFLNIFYLIFELRNEKILCQQLKAYT